MSTSVRLHSPSTQSLDSAVCTTLGVEAADVAPGVSFCPHYLIQMISMVSMGSGLLTARQQKGARTQFLCVAPSEAAQVSAPVLAAVDRVGGNDATRCRRSARC